MNSEARARLSVVALGASLFARGLTPGRTGNMSIRLDSGHFLMTPSGVSLGELEPGELSVIDESGNLLDGRPATKEVGLHLALYRTRRGEAVLHLHSPHAMAYSCRRDLDPMCPIPFLTPYLPMRAHDLRLVPYSRPGSDELVAGVQSAAADSSSLLLQRHGSMVLRPNLADAADAAEEIEQAALVAMLAGDDADPLEESAVLDLVRP